VKPLRHSRLWLVMGRIAIAVVIVLSLAPMPRTGLEIEHGDKLGHFMGYLGLTFWYAQLCATRSELAWRALGLAAIGAIMEVLQSLTGWRTGNDPYDALANVAGALTGFVLGVTPAQHWLARAEQHFRRA